MSDVKKYEIEWRAWPGRVQCGGREIEYGVDEEDAKRRFAQRYRGVDFIDSVREIHSENVEARYGEQ